MKLIDATKAANHAAADMEATPENLMTEAAMSMSIYKLKHKRRNQPWDGPSMAYN